MTDKSTNNTETQTDSNEPELTLGQSVLKNATGLALFAFITAGVIALTQQTTKQQIDSNIAEAQARALYEITPKSSLDNDLLNSSIDLNSEAAKALTSLLLLGPTSKSANVYFAELNSQTHTIIYPTIAPDGYTTAIKLLVGVKTDGTLSGVRIIDHKETPGLGDKVELKKSDWVLSFEGKSLSAPDIDQWKVQKDGGDFDQFTGATITPRAVVNAVKNTLLFHNENANTLLKLKREQDNLKDTLNVYSEEQK